MDYNSDIIEDVVEEDIVNHRLVPISVSYSDTDNVYTFKPEGEYYSGSFKASNDDFRKLLYRMKAKDNITLPNSKKGMTYQSMIDNIKEKKCNKIFAWKSKLPKTEEELKGMMKRDNNKL